MTTPLTPEHRLLLGTRLKALRTARGLTADAVACDALGYASPHHAAVTRLERGVLKFVSRDHVLKLAAFYGIAPQALLPEGVALKDLAERPHEASDAEEPACDRASGLAPGAAASRTHESSTEHSEAISADTASPLNPARPTAVADEGPTPSLQARLRQLRSQQGLAPSAFAQKLNSRQAPVTERDVRDWESAARRPTPAQFEALAKATGASIPWMKTGRMATRPSVVG